MARQPTTFYLCKDEPEVLRAKARQLLDAFEAGDRIEREGTPFYCNRMMTMCHRKAGKCECDEYDKKATRDASR